MAINKFDTDTDAEIELLSNELREQNIEKSLVESHEKGSEGAIDLAEKILRIADEKENMLCHGTQGFTAESDQLCKGCPAA